MPVAQVPAGAGTADVTESSNAFTLPTGASCIREGEDMASLLVYPRMDTNVQQLYFCFCTILAHFDPFRSEHGRRNGAVRTAGRSSLLRELDSWSTERDICPFPGGDDGFRHDETE